MLNNFFSPFENRDVYEIRCKNIVEPERLHVTIWRMRIACWIPKSTNTLPEYVSFPLQQWLHERVSALHYTSLTHTVCSLRGTNWIFQPPFHRHRANFLLPQFHQLWARQVREFRTLKFFLNLMLYRVSQEECEILRESVPCVKL